VVSAVGGGLRFKEAQAVMMVTDTSSGVQVAVADGRAQSSDPWGAGAGGIYGLSALGGYGNTNQGKVVTGAFVDAFNKLVAELRVLPNR
jgi:hypothetical protein